MPLSSPFPSRVVRQAWIDLLIEKKPNIAVTLGSGLNCGADALNRDAKRFCCALERKVLGANWAAKPVRDRMIAIGFHEHPSSNRHMHMTITAPFAHEGRIATDGNRIWRKIRPCGDFWWGAIENLDGYARYITKDMGTGEDAEKIFIYVPRQTLRW